MMCHLISQMDAANMKKDTAQYCAVAVSVALVFVAIVVAAFCWHKKEVAFRVAIAKHDERCVPPSLKRCPTPGQALCRGVLLIVLISRCCCPILRTVPPMSGQHEGAPLDHRLYLP